MEKIGGYDLDELLLISSDLVNMSNDIHQFNSRKYKIKWSEYNVHPYIKTMGITHFTRGYNIVIGENKSNVSLIEIFRNSVRFYNISIDCKIFDNFIKVNTLKNEIALNYGISSYGKDFIKTYKKENGYWTHSFIQSTRLSNWLSKNGGRFCDFIDQEELQLMYRVECDLNEYS